MEGEREELERALLTSPFDVELRARYARTLAAAEQPEAAAEQWTLLSHQEPHRARAHVELCMLAHAARRNGEAAAHQKQARSCSDFEEVVATLDDAQRSLLQLEQPKLRVVGGGVNRRGPAEVVSITRSRVVRFSDVAGMAELKKTLRLKIVEPFLRPELFRRFKKAAGGGVLLYGPPGCGKTMIARAIASECEASFTAIGISDVLNMWIGESERNLANLFDKARSERPAVLFFDELDALAYSRSKAASDHTRTTVNEFLAQLDGLSGNNEGLLVLGATNMPWDVDEAMKRPGRFDRQIFVPPPDAAAREEMFRQKLRDVPVGEIDYAALARRSESLSGADIDGVIDLAKDAALSRAIEASTTAMRGDSDAERLTQDDLLAALEEAVPTTLDWLKTARNLVKFGGSKKAYRSVEQYLRQAKLY